MNIFKIGLVFLSGIGLLFGANQITERINHTEEVPYASEGEYGYCHHELYDDELPMLDNLSEEDRLLVEAKLDELLELEEITEEDFYNDRYQFHEIMEKLMDFIYDNNIEFEETYYHGHMGRRR